MNRLHKKYKIEVTAITSPDVGLRLARLYDILLVQPQGSAKRVQKAIQPHSGEEAECQAITSGGLK